MDRPLIVSVSLAAADNTDFPEVVAETLLLRTVIVPGVAPEGIWRVTVKLHDVPGDMLPPEKVRVPVPLKLDPVPQILLCVAVVEARPVSAELKSTVKPTPVASAVAFAE